jgi:hypothetical protein
MDDDAAQLKAELKKLNFAATQLKMDLHDLSEELPIGWENIMEAAQRTYDCYAKIDELRRRLAAAPAG